LDAIFLRGKEYGSDLFDMPSRVHLPMQNAKHRHSLDRGTVVDDVLLLLWERRFGAISSRERPMSGLTLNVENAWSSASR
jgi:hypothetical protein